MLFKFLITQYLNQEAQNQLKDSHKIVNNIPNTDLVISRNIILEKELDQYTMLCMEVSSEYNPEDQNKTVPIKNYLVNAGDKVTFTPDLIVFDSNEGVLFAHNGKKLYFFSIEADSDNMEIEENPQRDQKSNNQENNPYLDSDNIKVVIQIPVHPRFNPGEWTELGQFPLTCHPQEIYENHIIEKALHMQRHAGMDASCEVLEKGEVHETEMGLRYVLRKIPGLEGELGKSEEIDLETLQEIAEQILLKEQDIIWNPNEVWIEIIAKDNTNDTLVSSYVSELNRGGLCLCHLQQLAIPTMVMWLTNFRKIANAVIPDFPDDHEIVGAVLVISGERQNILPEMHFMPGVSEVPSAPGAKIHQKEGSVNNKTEERILN